VKRARAAQPHSFALGGAAHWLTGFCHLKARPYTTAVGYLALQHYPLADLVADQSMDRFPVQQYQLG